MTWHEVELRGWRLTGSYRPADIKTPIIDIMSVTSDRPMSRETLAVALRLSLIRHA